MTGALRGADRARAAVPRAAVARGPHGPRAGAPGLRGFKDGFTLLEIAVVLFIMGLMLLIAIPQFGGFRSAQLKSAARRLAGRANYLFEEAAARKLVIRLVFDLDRNAYAVMIADPYAASPMFFADRSPADAPVVLPLAVRIRDVTVQGAGTFTRGAVACQFYPEGYADATLIHLVDASGDEITLALNSLTGRVSIANGDLTQTQFAGQ